MPYKMHRLQLLQNSCRYDDDKLEIKDFYALRFCYFINIQIQFVVRLSFPIQLSSSSNDSFYGKLENYEIEKKIGKGQFSVVYRARCLAVSEESDDPPIVALKKVQIFEMMDAKARLDCMKEIQLLQVYSRIYREVRVIFILSVLL